MTTPFPSDHEHAAWDREYVERFWAGAGLDRPRAGGVQRLVQAARRARSICSGTASISPSRASPAATPRRSRPTAVTREAYSSEVISFGFWAGDDNLGDAAYLLLHGAGARRPARAAAGRRGVDGHRQRLARDPALRGGPHRRRPADDAARVPAERLRGGRAHRRLGHLELRVELVPHARTARGAADQRRRRLRPAHRCRVTMRRTP